MLKKAVVVLCAFCLVFLTGCREKKQIDTVSSAPSPVSSGETTVVSSEETKEVSSEVPPTESTVSTVSETPSSAPSNPVSKAPTPKSPAPSASSDCPDGMSQDTFRYLMSLDNTRSGHGWLHSENRQSYFDRFGALTTADRSQPVVYLTFDEGYENGYTPTILDTLAEKGVKVVFFITMDYAKKNAALVQRMIQEGHAVGNHSTTHPSFPSLSVKAACAEVQQLHDYVQQHFNYTMHLFRFPSGDHSDRMLATLQSLGYTSVFWNFAHRDWDPADQPTYEETLSRILANTQNGTIYLLHAVSASDTAVLGQAIDEIRARGYSFGLLP